MAKQKKKAPNKMSRADYLRLMKKRYGNAFEFNTTAKKGHITKEDVLGKDASDA